MLFISNHVLFSRPSFSNSFIDFYSCKVASSSDMKKNKAYYFASIMAVYTKLWIQFMQVVAKYLHFVMSYMKQNKKCNQTLKSVQYRLEIIF